MPLVTIRPSSDVDVTSINAIYNSYISGSHVSFDTEPWTHDERSRWLKNRQTRGYPVLVAERDGEVIGTSWAGPWRNKRAYSRSVETTIVLACGAEGAGIGSRLYEELLDDLKERGFHRCYAVVALPNDASVGFHHNHGFTDIGVLDEVGFKDGAFVSTLVLERRL